MTRMMTTTMRTMRTSFIGAAKSTAHMDMDDDEDDDDDDEDDED